MSGIVGGGGVGVGGGGELGGVGGAGSLAFVSKSLKIFCKGLGSTGAAGGGVAVGVEVGTGGG